MVSAIERWKAPTLSDPFKRQLNLAWRLARGLAVAAFVTGFTQAWLPGLGLFLLIFGIPMAAIAALAGAAVLVTDGVGNLKATYAAERVLGLLVGPALLAAAFWFFMPVLQFGSRLGDWTQLGAYQPLYNKIVALAGSKRESKWYSERGGVSYTVDLGPPVRVAFDPRGFLSNWSGIVFDPTGEVMTAKGFDAQGRFFAPDRITKLFGGDLVGCRPLWGDYYKCSFT